MNWWDNLNSFFSGAIALGLFMSAVYFRRFWQRTGVRLFQFFAVAFLLLAVERVILVLTNTAVDTVAYIYIIRLVGFLLIIAGIINHNRAGPR